MFQNLDLVTILLIALNVLISYKGFNDYSFFEKYKFNVGAVKNGEHFRNVTSGFLHADPQHLLFNMITFFFFAPIVTYHLDMYKLALVYVVSLLLGSLLSFTVHKNNNYYSAIGASGAVTGVLYAAIMLEPDMTINFFIPGWLFGIGYLAYSIYGMKKSIGNIGHAAHLGGAIGGYVMAILLNPKILENHLFYVVLIGLPIVALFVLLKRNRV